MKHRLPYMLLMAACLMTAAACKTEGYDSGDGEYSYLRADFAEAHADASKRLRTAMTDDGDSLVFDTPLACAWATKGDSTYRALLYYSREEVGGLRVRGISAAQVLVLAPARLKEGARMYADPVVFESSWLSANGKYLNLGMYLKTGKSDDERARHSVGMVLDTTIVGDNGARQHLLRLYHNRSGMPEHYSSRFYASMPLAPFAKGDSLRVEINTYEGLLVRTFVVE